MCNACAFTCCASDEFEGCGCESCNELACRRVECELHPGVRFDVVDECPECEMSEDEEDMY